MEDKTFNITFKELEIICGECFDKGYYSALYQGHTDDRSVVIWSGSKLFNNIVKRLDESNTQMSI